MTCHLPTDRQKRYAERLAERLRRDGHIRASHFERELAACICIANMSDLIDQMKDALEED